MLGTVLAMLIASFLSVGLARYLGLSPIVGFLLVGVLFGPNGAAMVGDSHAIRQMAEFGMVFLMFTIGLEFSLSHYLGSRR